MQIHGGRAVDAESTLSRPSPAADESVLQGDETETLAGYPLVN